MQVAKYILNIIIFLFERTLNEKVININNSVDLNQLSQVIKDFGDKAVLTTSNSKIIMEREIIVKM